MKLSSVATPPLITASNFHSFPAGIVRVQLPHTSDMSTSSEEV
jgi:hypothetical protein